MEKYICPNDRQLALRARLGTGWSSRAQLLQNQTADKLSTGEEEQILQVLKRNEDVLQQERLRIEQMLHKLDRMRQLTTTHTRNECGFCKQEFGRISRLPVICDDCGRSVCTTCSIEISIAPMHSTNGKWISMWPGTTSLTATPVHRNYGAYFRPMRHASDNETDHDQLQRALSRKRQVKMDHIRDASSGFVRRTHRLINKFRMSKTSTLDQGHLRICQLCAGAREVWKRSGAWFYKALPNYHSASCQVSPSASGEKMTVTSLRELVEPPNMDNENEEHSWVKLQPRIIMAHQYKQPLTHFVSDPEPILNTQKASDSFNRGSNESHMGGLVTLQKWEGLHGSSATQRSRLGEQEQTVATTVYPGKSNNPRESSASAYGRPVTGTSAQHALVYANSKSPGSSSASELASSLGLMTASKKVASLTGEETVPAIRATQDMNIYGRGLRKYSEDAPFGILYFTLYNDTFNKQLHVTIHKAKNLIAMDANGLSDPYVVCQLLPSSHNNLRPRTSTCPQCLNPVWNEALTFEPFDEKSMRNKTLRFAVLDEDLYGSDWLGEYWLPLNQLASDRLTDFAVPLGPKKPLQRSDLDLACPTRGKIQLGLRYMEDKKQLCIEVIRCSNLAPMDPNGLSDPFVKLYLRPDKAKKTKQKTRVIKATLDPEFNEHFVYDMQPSEASYRTLELTVWDFDRGPSNDFIGGLTLGASAKAERRELWLAVFRSPYRRIEAWFQLSNRTDNSIPSTTPGICD